MRERGSQARPGGELVPASTRLMLLGVGLGGLAWLAAGEVMAQRLTARRRPDPANHPARYGLTHEEVGFLSRDGLVLRGWWLPTEEPRGTVIVAPGQEGSLDADLRYAPPLVDQGFNVFIFDFRGHGRSAGSAVTFGYGEVMDLRGALDWLEARGQQGIGVLGLSMGAAVALTTAAHDRRIRAVVADSPFARLVDVVAAGLLDRAVPGPLTAPLARLALWRASRRLGAALTVAEPARWADQVEQPVLLLHGGRDRFVPAAAIHALATALAGPHEVWAVPEADHRELDLLRPGEYLERVVGWFQRFLSPAGEQGVPS